MSDLIRRLLKQETTGWAYNDSRKPVKELRNPDGPEAADRIAEMEAENARFRNEFRIGDRVTVIGDYETCWRGVDLWITGINADHEGVKYTVGEQWPVPNRHMSGYLGMTDGFREEELARAALKEVDNG
jgi:hypothetical protein